MRVALLTIGQSPRPDLTLPLEQMLPAHIHAEHAGLLDGLSKEQVQTLFSPSLGGTPLVTRLSSGEEVLISGESVRRALEVRIDTYRTEGLEAIILLCTGVFEGLDSSGIRLIQPDQIVPDAVRAQVGEAKLGVIVPTDKQLEPDDGKWRAWLRPPVYAAASPYASDWPVALGRAALALREAGAEYIVLDCMGYGESHAQLASKIAGVPVLVSRLMLASSLSSLFAPAR